MYVDHAEGAIISGLVGLASRLRDPEAIVAALEQAHGASAARRNRQRSALLRKRDDLVRQRDRLLSLVLAEKIDADLYRDRDDALKGEMAAVADELSAVPPAVDIADIRKRHAAVKDLVFAINPKVVDRDVLVPMLTELDARLIVGDGAPYLQVGGDLAPFFGGG